MDGIASRDRESMHMHGQVLRISAEPSTETDDEQGYRQDEHEDEDERVETRSQDSRRSVIQEFKRQSGVFFDDYGDVDGDGEDSGVRDEDLAVAPPTGAPGLVDGHDKQE